MSGFRRKVKPFLLSTKKIRHKTGNDSYLRCDISISIANKYDIQISLSEHYYRHADCYRY